jgi:hypothetical protein
LGILVGMFFRNKPEELDGSKEWQETPHAPALEALIEPGLPMIESAQPIVAAPQGEGIVEPVLPSVGEADSVLMQQPEETRGADSGYGGDVE